MRAAGRGIAYQGGAGDVAPPVVVFPDRQVQETAGFVQKMGAELRVLAEVAGAAAGVCHFV